MNWLLNREKRAIISFAQYTFYSIRHLWRVLRRLFRRIGLRRGRRTGRLLGRVASPECPSLRLCTALRARPAVAGFGPIAQSELLVRETHRGCRQAVHPLAVGFFAGEFGLNCGINQLQLRSNARKSSRDKLIRWRFRLSGRRQRRCGDRLDNGFRFARFPRAAGHFCGILSGEQRHGLRWLGEGLWSRKENRATWGEATRNRE